MSFVSRPGASLHCIRRDAAEVIRRVACELGPVGVVALVIGMDGEAVDVCICADDELVEERSRLLLELYADEARAVVFATLRTGPPLATVAERARHRRLRNDGAELDVPVLDWLIVTEFDAEHRRFAAPPMTDWPRHRDPQQEREP
jgi:hypothetical protein